MNFKLETSNSKLETQIQSVSEVLGKGVLVWAEEHAKDKLVIENQRKQIAKLGGELNQRSIIVSDSIAIHKRFLVHAREGMIDRAKTTYQRSPEVAAIINKGNDVAHRANVHAHVITYQEGQLSPDDIATFEKMYSLHPAKWQSSLISPKAVEMWNMMGTIAATLARIKFRSSSYSRDYQAFLVLCEKTRSIRVAIEKEKGTGEDAKKAFDEHDEVTSNLEKMKEIVDKFTQQDKVQRSSNED